MILTILGGAQLLLGVGLAAFESGGQPFLSSPSLALALLAAGVLLARPRGSRPLAIAVSSVLSLGILAQLWPPLTPLAHALSGLRLADAPIPVAVLAALLPGFNAVFLLTTRGAAEFPANLRYGTKRIPCRIRGTFETRAGIGQCEVLDMSIGGLLLSVPASRDRLAEGDELSVRFPLKGTQVPIKVQARVVHLGRKGPDLAGVKFLDESPF